MLLWDRSEKIGECEIVQKHNGEDVHFTLNLYNGNALLIAEYEYNDTETGERMCQLQWFFLDEYHMKNMLGLNKKDGYTSNTLSEIKKLRLNKAKCKDIDKIVKAFAKAFDTLTIELYKEE